MAVTVTVELDEDDYAEGILAGAKLMVKRPRRRIVFTPWVIVSIAILILFKVQGRVPSLGDILAALREQWYFFGPMFALVVLLWVLMPIAKRSRGKELREKFRKRASLHGPRTYRFDEEGLHATGENFSTNHPWNQLAKWAEDERFIFLSMQQLSFEIIPKRDLSSEEDLVELRALLTANVGPPASLASSAKQVRRA